MRARIATSSLDLEKALKMKYSRWKRGHGFKTEEDVRLYFHNNLINNRLPVAMYVCPKCDEILTNDDCTCWKCSKMTKKKWYVENSLK